VPSAVLIRQHLKHVQGASSASERPTLLPRVRHREDLSPTSRRHIPLWQYFFEGILAVLSVESNSSNGDLSLAYLDQPVSLLMPRRPSVFPQLSCWEVLTPPTSVLEIPPSQNNSQERQLYSLPAKLAGDWQNKEATPKKGLVCNPLGESGCSSFTTCPASSLQPVLTTLLPPVLVPTTLSEVLFAGHFWKCSPAFWTTPDALQFSVIHDCCRHWSF